MNELSHHTQIKNTVTIVYYVREICWFLIEIKFVTITVFTNVIKIVIIKINGPIIAEAVLKVNMFLGITFVVFDRTIIV